MKKVAISHVKRALARFVDNQSKPVSDGYFWKMCAWAMADDLKQAMKQFGVRTKKDQNETD